MMTTIHVTYARVRISFLLSYTDLIDVRRVAAQTDRLIDRSTTAGARTEVRPGLVTRVFYGTDEPAPWTTRMRNGRERLAWALRGSTNSSALPKVKKKKKNRRRKGKSGWSGSGSGMHVSLLPVASPPPLDVGSTLESINHHRHHPPPPIPTPLSHTNSDGSFLKYRGSFICVI